MSEDIERIAQRIKCLEMAAGLTAPNYHPPTILQTADKLWAWAAEKPEPQSKTARNVAKGVERLRASQADETF